MSSVRVDLGPRSYDINIGGEWSGFGKFARDRSSAALAVVVTDENVRPQAVQAEHALAAAGFRVNGIVVKPGEASKSLETASMLYDRLADLRADRKTLVVAVGGGVIGDLAGFSAATFNRGLPLLMVPTTLLAMVDSSVGGKVGINHPRAKNLIGAFHQPVGVWIDPTLLATLPSREYRSGLAEVVKYGVILDAAFFAYLETHTGDVLSRETGALNHIVGRSCRLKADVVEQDEREETGLRAVLNYGHTFAHAFEKVTGYGTLLHGEAVAMGMVCASRLAERLGLVPASVTERQVALLQAFGLPVRHEPQPTEPLLNVMRSDKKNVAGRLRLILPVRLGEVRLFEDVAESEVVAVLQELAF